MFIFSSNGSFQTISTHWQTYLIRAKSLLHSREAGIILWNLPLLFRMIGRCWFQSWKVFLCFKTPLKDTLTWEDTSEDYIVGEGYTTLQEPQNIIRINRYDWNYIRLKESMPKDQFISLVDGKQQTTQRREFIK